MALLYVCGNPPENHRAAINRHPTSKLQSGGLMLSLQFTASHAIYNSSTLTLQAKQADSFLPPCECEAFLSVSTENSTDFIIQQKYLYLYTLLGLGGAGYLCYEAHARLGLKITSPS